MRRLAPAIALAALVVCSPDLAAAVTGHVIDEDGKPIAGARVRAIALASAEASDARLISAAPEPVALATAVTDERGAFRVDTKREPVVTLIVDAPGRAVRVTEAVDGEDAGASLLRAAPMQKGRVTAGGRPVAGAWLIVSYSYYTRTDEQGNYSVPDLTGWGYSMLVIHPDFAIAEQTRRRDATPSLDVTLDKGTVARGRVVDPAGRPVANATVYAGSWPLAKSAEDGTFTIAHLPSNVKSISAREGKRTGIAKRDAETIVVRPGATLTGTVRSTKDDTPVAGMRVSLPGDALDRTSAGTITDARGSFTLDGLPAGVTSIALWHPAFNSANAEVTLSEGARVERAFAATPLGRVAGVVVDEEKKPVGGAQIMAIPSMAYTAPDGSFSVRLAALERASMLEVTKPSYANASHGPLRVEPGETRSGIRIVLPRGTKFEIKLVDVDGVAIAGEPVMITRRLDPGAPMPNMPLQCGRTLEARGCRSDAEGKVSFSAGEGPHDIRAGGTNTVEKRLRGQTFAAADSPLVIELESGAVIEGRVVWTDGSPVTLPANVVTPGGFTGPGTPVVNGAFTIRNLPAGKVTLAANLAPPTPMQGEPVEVTAPASGVVLKLPRFGRIEGRVVEREGQRPVKQFSVALESRGTFRAMSRGSSTRAFTADDGRFVMEDVPPGSVDVMVTAPGFVRASTTAVEVEEAKAAKVEITVERAGTVTGHVTSGGRPVAGATVGMANTRGRWNEAKQTDANGEYTLDQLAPGAQELTARKDGYVARTITVNVEVGKDARGDVELSRGRELQVRVIDSMGKPVPLAEVLYTTRGRQGRDFGAMRSTDAEGMYRIEGLGDETYTVTARKSGYAEGSTEVNPATSSSVTITLGRGGSLSGRVTGLPAAELQLVDVHASPIGVAGPSVRGTVDATGAFTIAGIPDGEVIVRAQQGTAPRRSISSNPVKVTAGVAPFVELDFNAGFAIRGKVTRRGQIAPGFVHFASVDPRNRTSAGAEIKPDGTYETRVSTAGEYRVLATLRNNSIGTIETGRIDVRGDMTHDIDVRGASVKGRVIDAITRAPIPDARVSLVSAKGGGTDRPADSSGRFVFEFVADGAHTIRALKDGYYSDPREIAVQNGSDAEVEVMLERGELVVVTVVDGMTGSNVDAFVGVASAVAEKTHGDRGADRDASGTYRFWLRPGSYAIRVMTRDYEPKTVPLVVPGTPAVRVELTPVRRD